MRLWILAGLGAMTTGCVQPLEPLPVEAQGVSGFIFQHFDDADTTDLARAISEILAPFLDDKIAGVKDPSDPYDPTWLAELPTLSEAELGSLSMPDGTTTKDQFGSTGRARTSAFPLSEHRTLATEPNRVCLESESSVYGMREFTSDDACFADGSCSRLTALQPTFKQNEVARIWYDQLFDLREIDIVLEDGTATTALLTRGWLEERWFSRTGSSHWDQIWSLDVLIDGADDSVGWNAYWTALDISLLTRDFIEPKIREGLHQTADWTEHFIANGEPSPDCPNDRDEKMPERWENEGN